MCAMDPCLTPLGSPKSRALSHHKALQKINPIGHSIVARTTDPGAVDLIFWHLSDLLYDEFIWEIWVISET